MKKFITTVSLMAFAVSGCGHHELRAPLKLPPKSLATDSLPQASVPFGASGQVLTSYNTGLQIGNYVLLYRVTHDRRYITKAEILAKAGFQTFGALAYQIPPGNTEAFGSIYLRQLRTLTRYSSVATALYKAQRSGYIAFVKSHPARGGSAHRWPSGLWSDKQQHYAYLWPFAMLVAAAESKGNYRAADALRYYWNGRAWRSSLTTKTKPAGDLYWDDNAWAAMDEWTAYVATRRSVYFYYLKKDFDFLRAGWSKFGGVRWVDAGWNRDIAAVSTAGMEQVALDLYLATSTVHNHLRFNYRAWALWAQRWLDAHMRVSSGLLYDHLTPCGRKLCWTVPTPPGPVGKSFSDPLLYIAAQSV